MKDIKSVRRATLKCRQAVVAPPVFKVQGGGGDLAF